MCRQVNVIILLILDILKTLLQMKAQQMCFSILSFNFDLLLWVTMSVNHVVKLTVWQIINKLNDVQNVKVEISLYIK